VPLFWLATAFLCGLLLSAWLSLPTYVWWGATAACLLLVVLFRIFKDRIPWSLPQFPFAPKLPIFLLVLAILAGAGRYASAQPRLSPEVIAWYSAGEADYALPVLVEGVVDKFPDRRDAYTNLTVRVERVYKSERSTPLVVSGLLLVKVPPDNDFQYGDRLLIKGSLETPPDGEDFSYRLFLLRKGILVYMPWAEAELLETGQGNLLLNAIYALKYRALDLVYRIYPDPEASLLAGILLGVEGGIPKPVMDAFKATGTAHVIAISGFNITIIAGLFATLFGRILGKRWGALAALVGISLYTVFVGAMAAVVRAAIMGGFSLFARQVGRRQDGLNTLALTAALMAVFNPHILWDIGFQLSFSATLGLLLYAGPFSEAFRRLAARRLPPQSVEKLAGPVGEYVLFTFAAQLTTLPVMAYHFGKISLTALIANPLILPAQPAVMIAGGLAVIAGLVWQPLGQAAAYLAWPFVVFTVRVVEFFARFPLGEIHLGELGLLFVVLFYALLFGLSFPGKHLEPLKGYFRPAFVLGIMSVSTLLVWRAVFSAPDGRLHLTMLDSSTATTTGEAFLIQTPSGRSVLVGGGPSASLLSDSLGRRLPLKYRRLDWLVVAAHGDDRVAALPRALDRFPAEQVLWAGPFNSSRSDRYLDAYLTSNGIPVTPALPGQALDLGDGCRLEVLAVSQRGAILLLEWQNFRALLPMGASREDFARLDFGKDMGPVSVLSLADGGHALVNPPEWIKNMNPQIALLSVAAGDRRGLPSPRTMESLEGYHLLRTDMNGWIQVTTDGERMWVEVESR
jgi:competence protein ComEC